VGEVVTPAAVRRLDGIEPDMDTDDDEEDEDDRAMDLSDLVG